MSIPKKADKALLFVACLYSKYVDYNAVVKDLEDKFYKIRFCSLKVPFVWSDYYENEMGTNLKRVFFIFDKVEREFLVDAKKLTDTLEIKYSRDSKRLVNLDAGIQTKENILLATNKAFFHRIYMRNGVYSELTLFYKKGSYRGIEYWSYPEYTSSAVINFFNESRSLLF